MRLLPFAFVLAGCSTTQLEITSPVEGAQVNAPVVIGIDLTGDPDDLQSIELSAGGEPIGVIGRDGLFADELSFEWSSPGARGPVTLEARAFDLIGAEVARDSVDVIVGATALPGGDATVDVVEPGAGTVVPVGNDVNVVATTTGDPTKLLRVEITVDGAVLATLRSAPFSATWSTTGVSGGEHRISAAAYLIGGGVVRDDDTPVTIDGPVIDPPGEGEGEGPVGEGEGEGEDFPPGWVPPPAHPFARVSDFPSNASGTPTAANPGNLSMFLHVPANLPPSAPVVVALHGCTQDATQYRTTSGWTALADAHKVIVIFPEQIVTAEHSPTKTGNPMRCFNFAGYYGERMARGEGENQSIKEMVDYVAAHYSVDTSRVFATGLSAGGAMVSLLLATWPDVFAGGAPMAGIPYACADDVNGAIACMNGDASRGASPSTWGDRVRAGGPAGYAGPWPRVQVWHGDADFTVRYANANELVDQWTNVHGADLTADVTSPLKDGASHTRAAYTANGDVVVELVTLTGMGHGIAIDPGSGVDQGGGAGGFAFDRGIHSTYYAAQFFGIVDESPASPGEGEGEGEGGACEEVTSTIVLHQYALPPRVRNSGSIVAPVYEVIGSGEVIGAEVNPYLDDVTVHSDGSGFALGACP